MKLIRSWVIGISHYRNSGVLGPSQVRCLLWEANNECFGGTLEAEEDRYSDRSRRCSNCFGRSKP